MKTLRLLVLLNVAVLASALTGRADSNNGMNNEVKEAIQLLKENDSSLHHLFETAAGYAVFPSVAKGAIGIGAAHGGGEVFEKGRRVGTAEMTQVTIGAQLGGQEYIEVLFFETKDALDEFKGGKFALSADVSAVAAAEGVSASAKYRHGVLVFTLTKNGLMFEASVGGQKFSYTPLGEK